MAHGSPDSATTGATGTDATATGAARAAAAGATTAAGEAGAAAAEETTAAGAAAIITVASILLRMHIRTVAVTGKACPPATGAATAAAVPGVPATTPSSRALHPSLLDGFDGEDDGSGGRQIC